MPAAIPLVVNAAMTYAEYTAAQVAVATLVTSAVVGKYQHDKAKRDARRAYNRSLQDRTITVRSGVSTRKYVVGRMRVGGTLAYVEAVGPKMSMLDSIVALAGNRCELIEYFFNDEHVAVGDWPYGTYASTDQTRDSYRTSSAVGPGPVTLTLPHAPAAGTARALTFDPMYGVQGAEITPVSVTGANVSFTLPSASHVEVVYEYVSAALKLRLDYSPGYADQPASSWPDVATPGWTVDHRLSGIANLRALMTWDEKLYASGAPQLSAVLDGGGIDEHGVAPHRFYDPRSQTYPTFTDNPALIALWWMTLARRWGGCGIPLAMVDLSSVSAAANVCDESITVRTLAGDGYESIPRYRCHALLDTERSALENLDIILTSMAGSRAFPGAGGKYRIFAGAWRPAEHTITDHDIVATEPFVITTAQEAAPPNVVKATFVDASRSWMESSPPVVRNDAYIASDGAETVLDLTLEATTDARQANYLMGVELERRRPHFSGSCRVGGCGENIAVGDVLEFDLENRGQYDGRTFEVVRIVDRWDGTFDIEFDESKASTYALDADSFLPTSVGAPVDTSHLWNVARIMSLSVSYGTPQVISPALTLTQMTITWDQHAQQYVRDTGRIELRFREIGTDEWRGIPEVPGNAVGTIYTAALRDGAAYEVQARARNGNGAVSDWASTLDAVNGVLAAGALKIIASGIAFRIDTYGAGTPSEIQLSAALSGPLTGPVTWAVVGSGSATLTINGDDASLAVANMAGDVVSIRASATYQGVTFSDLITIIKVHDGPAGARGDIGSPGSLTGYGAAYGMTPSAWDDQLASRVIFNMLTNGMSATGLADTTHLLIGDTVTLSNGSDWAETRFWDGAGSWLVPGMVIDGNLLVNGTVSATKITAGSIVTGAAGNARIRIGDTSFIGSGVNTIRSPLHVEKVSANANQALITALNDKDSSVAIWGASANASGNAVTGTYHYDPQELATPSWRMIGALGSSYFGAAVAGNSYASYDAAVFRYYSGINDKSPGTNTTIARLAASTYALQAQGPVQIVGAASPIRLGLSDGTAGQVLTSQGAGQTPIWAAGGGGGGVNYGQIQSALAGTTGSALNLTTTFRATGLNAPVGGAGVEVAYASGQGSVIAFNRAGGTYMPLQVSGSTLALNASSSISFGASSSSFNHTPSCTTAAVATNSTAVATTAYVVSRIAQDAPTKAGVGASGTWNISVSGAAASVGGVKVKGGSGSTSGAGATATVSTGLASVAGFSAIAVDGYVCVVTNVSGGSVTVGTRLISTGAAGVAAFRWIATGT